jgi:hypothetical protein
MAAQRTNVIATLAMRTGFANQHKPAIVGSKLLASFKTRVQIALKFYVPTYWPNFFLTHQMSTKLNKLLTTT